MSRVMHPRPNPIVAAMYTLRDMDVDVIVVHGPAGCSFMASRPLEMDGVRIVTSAMKDKDLIFGGMDSLYDTLKNVKETFDPNSVAVVGTCASTIIGDDVGAVIRRIDWDNTKCFHVDCSGCLPANTQGAIRAIRAGAEAGMIDNDECERQVELLQAATRLEKLRGMTSRQYISPATSPTKMNVCKRIADVLSSGGKVAVIMISKKELAYRFADMFLAVEEARAKLGGERFFIANLDGSKGLPRIRRYCHEITTELDSKGSGMDRIIGGLDEYAIIGDDLKRELDTFDADLRIFMGICHSYPDLRENDILITDQPRELANYLDQGFPAVGEVSSHGMVMGAHSIIPLETAQTLRELIR